MYSYNIFISYMYYNLNKCLQYSCERVWLLLAGSNDIQEVTVGQFLTPNLHIIPKHLLSELNTGSTSLK